MRVPEFAETQIVEASFFPMISPRWPVG